MIDMCDIVPGLQFPQGPEGDRLVLVIGLFDLVFVITLKDLVIGIADDLQVLVDKSLMDGMRDRIEGHFRLQVLEDGSQPFQLPGVLRKKAKGVFLVLPGFEIFYQQIELPVKGGLGAGVEFESKTGWPLPEDRRRCPDPAEGPNSTR